MSKTRVETQEKTMGRFVERSALALMGLRDFRWNLLATVSTIGALQFWRYAQGWHVLELTQSAFWVGMATFAAQIPVLFLVLVAGIVNDRVPRKHLLTFANVGFAMLVLLLGVLAVGDVISVWQIIVVALFSGIFASFYLPGHHAIVADILPGELAPKGIALTAAGIYVSYVVLALLLGWLLDQVGAGGSYFIAAGIFGLSAMMLVQLRLSSHSVASARRSLTQELRQMVQYIKTQRRLVLLLANSGVPSLSGYMFALVLFPVFVKEVYHSQAPVLGYLVAALGFGSMLGSAASAQVSGFKRKGLLHLVALFSVGAAACLFALSSDQWLGIFFTVLIGLTAGFFNALNPGLAVSMSPAEFRGRTLGLYHLFFVGTAPLGALLAGAFADWIGPQEAVFLGGSVTMAVAVVVGALATSIRRIQ